MKKNGGQEKFLVYLIEGKYVILEKWSAKISKFWIIKINHNLRR